MKRLTRNAKRCVRCERIYRKSDFYTSKRHKDGLQSWCKSCHSEQGKIRRATRRQELTQAAFWDQPAFPEELVETKTAAQELFYVGATPGPRREYLLSLRFDEDGELTVEVLS